MGLCFVVVKAAAGGSISAEHGIGQLKRKFLPLNRSPEELQLMRGIKVGGYRCQVPHTNEVSVPRVYLLCTSSCDDCGCLGCHGSCRDIESWENDS